MALSTVSQAEELVGQQAANLISESEIIISRIALDRSENKVVEIVLQHEELFWICDFYIESSPVSEFNYWKFASERAANAEKKTDYLGFANDLSGIIFPSRCHLRSE